MFSYRVLKLNGARLIDNVESSSDVTCTFIVLNISTLHNISIALYPQSSLGELDLILSVLVTCNTIRGLWRLGVPINSGFAHWIRY